MDGPFYLDYREPHIFADVAAVTLASTYKALLPLANLPPLGMNYFSRPGKKVRIRASGRITTGATPGNLQVGLFYGTGADANGVTVAQSAAVALTASQTNLSWICEITLHCRSVGSSGTLFAMGQFEANVGVLASTLQPVMIPASAPAVSSSCDLTNSALVLSLQALRSGSTAETMQVHDFDFIPLN